ncbi:hypothetical protein Vi05172_g9375 [Venturia inaequalis]|nr:hypothetical protein Vi05172_g9375 [Venturia inaequalis]
MVMVIVMFLQKIDRRESQALETTKPFPHYQKPKELDKAPFSVSVQLRGSQGVPPK